MCGAVGDIRILWLDRSSVNCNKSMGASFDGGLPDVRVWAKIYCGRFIVLRTRGLYNIGPLNTCVAHNFWVAWVALGSLPDLQCFDVGCPAQYNACYHSI